MRPLFVLTLLTGSFLLFLLQPLVARIALPRLGGAPAVWTSAMLVYQALLLGGYAWAHGLARLAPRTQAALHLLAFLVAALWLPIGLGAGGMPAGADPVWWVPGLFLAGIGPLFLVVAAQAPLMQRWFALAAPQADPFPLYAASNLGSFAGLIAYPMFMEPLLTVATQRWVWSGGFALLALLAAACALRLPRHLPPAARMEGADERIGVRRVLLWMALAAVPSGLILSTSTHLGTDLVAMPLLWVVPLGLYLLSFVLAFAPGRLADRIAALLPLALAAGAATAFAYGAATAMWAIAAALIFLFVAATALHRRVYLLRPAPARLTLYYLALAVGGALGGLFCAVVAPMLFDWGYEGPILILAAAALGLERPWLRLPDRVATVLAIVGAGLGIVGAASEAGGPLAIGAAILLAAGLLAASGRRTLSILLALSLMLATGGWRALVISADGRVRTRSWFGVYTVADRGDRRELISGTTLHGVQRTAPNEQTWPISYYAPSSGVGIALRFVPALYGPKASVGVVGLGTGTLACYARPGERWTFFEIDPAIVRIATDPARFTFLSRCAPKAAIVLGDARLSLAAQPPHALNLLAVDAFSSDAVPMHLLTAEAFAVYGRVLAQDGLLLVHISNRYLDLEPIVAAAAAEGGWAGAVRDYVPSAISAEEGAGRSVWVALTRRTEVLDRLTTDDGRRVGGWTRLRPKPGIRGWTDDYASILPVLRR
nr:fused MFS/spermidine synthase [Sphingomonas jatrophae]